GERQATVAIGEPLDVTERWPIYSQGHRAAKQAVESLTQDLQTGLEGLIGKSSVIPTQKDKSPN
ncbi:MAG TPA: hypothetical protein V6D06_12695, partial [Trichocoleus sp.]